MSDKETVPLLHQEQSPIAGRRFILTVELPMLACLFSSTLIDGVISNLLLYRTCITDLHYDADKCKMLQSLNKTDEAKLLESEVEAHTTVLMMTLSVIGGVMPAILSAFVGSWSDKYGRRPLILSPLLGQMLTTILVTLYSTLTSLRSWWFLLCIIPYTMLGGSTTFTLGCYLLITDITDDTNRSFRLALLQGCGFLGVLLGSVSSSYVFEALGYVYVFVLATLVFSVSYIYTWFCVNESLQNVREGTFKDLFDMQLLKDMYHVSFKRRRPAVATILFLLISAYGITMFCVSGVDNLDYFFTRQKFQWMLREYNIFSAINTIVIVFGIFVGIAFFQKVCRMSDGVLLILSYISSISEAVARCFANKSWHMYLAGAMSMLGGLSPPMIRSQVAKIIPKPEVGKMYSLMTCVESILPIFSPLLYNMIYWRTLVTFPGVVYAVSAGLFSLCLIFVSIAEFLSYRIPQEYYTLHIN